MNRPGSSRRGTLGGGGTLVPASSLTSSNGATIPASATLPAAVAAAVVAPELLPAATAPHLHFAPMYSDVALLASEASAPPVAFEAPEIDEVPTHIPIGERDLSIDLVCLLQLIFSFAS
jgi:hypothetical protein